MGVILNGGIILKNKINNYICDYVKAYPKRENTKSVWKEPLIAYADAGDPMFEKLREVITPSHEIPAMFLEGARTVITYFIPFGEDLVTSNIAGKFASQNWGIAYIETNQLIIDLNNFLKKKLKEEGYKAAVIPPTHNFDQDKLISDWSHRHVAYIAGLGKFGINNMLITEKGCCGRIGSIVTELEIEPTVRPKSEFCLYKVNGSCRKCVERCVNGALQSDSFDRNKCYQICRENNRRLSGLDLTDVCGKCLVDIPCSFINPVG